MFIKALYGSPDRKKVTLSKDLYMPFYLSDMTEFLYRLVKADDLKHHFYYMGSDNGISANELCLQIDSCLALSTHREQNTGDEMLWIDSRLPYNLADEVSCTCFTMQRPVSRCFANIFRNIKSS